ncbi:GPW/gp25 family protein [Serratia marcescens]|uniref:GPW/gp25 family protein n=1 Tax=Serratia marcescens TaxID=615 RepID=UPI001BAF71BA|nr:GPW/gp25 family protein [Serratia marcescens]MBS3892290.1 GPW/gp25 family protein [Serratia marcescens]
MTTAHYAGLNRETGGTVSDMAHIQQSITDILTTPKGTRVMCRNYGSDLVSLLDAPLTPELRMKVISATYSALDQWEPRITVSSVTAAVTEGRATITIKGYRRDTQTPITFSLPVTGSQGGMP